jgi:hypothetical protein
MSFLRINAVSYSRSPASRLKSFLSRTLEKLERNCRHPHRAHRKGKKIGAMMSSPKFRISDRKISPLHLMQRVSDSLLMLLIAELRQPAYNNSSPRTSHPITSRNLPGNVWRKS